MNLKEKYKNILSDKEFDILNNFGKPDLDSIVKLSLDNAIDLHIVCEFFVDKYKDEISKNFNKRELD